MSTARCRQEWDHTAAVLAMLANVNRDQKKGKPFSPKDFHPYERKQKDAGKPKKVPMSFLKSIFSDKDQGALRQVAVGEVTGEVTGEV